MKKIKIICTLGPSSENVSTLERMIQSGMNCVRLNFSHGTYENFDLLIKNIRQASKKCNANIAIIQDLQGPKIRVGELPKEGILVKKDQKITLTTRILSPKPSTLNPHLIPIQYRKLPQDVSANDIILIDDGLIELEVLKTNKKDTIDCIVRSEGTIKTHKGINVPTATITTSPITEKDKKDAIFGLKYNIDYIALSFVKSEKDIINLRKLLNKHNSKTKIIAKIERREAIENLEKIIQEADALMVARGDLGVEIEPEKVPIIQKEMVKLCNLYGKPVIIATQMLQSMVENSRASRAEISDAANAIFDHADAFMLSNETAVGKYPIEATKTLAHVAHATEKEIKKREFLIPMKNEERHLSIMEATCLNACEIANQIKANHLVLITSNGYTVKQTAKYRPYIEMITVTNNKKLQTELALVWGINKTIYMGNLLKNREINIEGIINILKKDKLIKTGEEVVMVNVRKQNYIIRTLKI